ncbi:MAG: MazG nucleotide pyrophosphohydrolase domain-containing protein [Planctomycetota bacterium]
MDIADFQARFAALTQGLEHPRIATALALVEEAGEVARCVLDHEVYGSPPGDSLVDEVGDTLAALAEVCARHGVTLSDAAERVLAKVEARAPRWREQLGDRLVTLRARWDGPAGA